MSAKPHANVWTDPLTPLVMLMRTARVFPKREAVVHGKLRWSYAKFAEEVGRMAGALRRAGVGQGDRVAVLAPNTPAHLVAHFAMPLLGAPLVSINTRLAPAEIAYILDHCGAKVLLVDPELAPPLDAILPRTSGAAAGDRDSRRHGRRAPGQARLGRLRRRTRRCCRSRTRCRTKRT